MSYSLINQGQSVKRQALGGLKTAADLETNRNLANKQLDRSEKQATTANAVAGATTGAMAGANMAATVAGAGSNAAVGALGHGATTAFFGSMGTMGAMAATGGIGLAAGLLLSELF